MVKLLATVFLTLSSALTTVWGNAEHDAMHEAIAEQIESQNAFIVGTDPRLKHFSEKVQKFKGQHHEDAHDAVAGYIKLKIESELLSLHQASEHNFSSQGRVLRLIMELPALLADPGEHNSLSADPSHWYWGLFSVYRSTRNEINSLLELLQKNHDVAHATIAKNIMMRDFGLYCLHTQHKRIGCESSLPNEWHKQAAHPTVNGRVTERVKAIHQQASHDRHVADHHHKHYAVHNAIQRFILGL